MFIPLPTPDHDAKTAAFIDAAEPARTWLSRELHDDIAQRLALLSAELGLLRHHLTNPSDETLRLVAKLASETAGIGADVSRIARGLQPVEFAHLALDESIRRLCERLCGALQMTVDLELDDVPASLGPDASLGLYRIAQEALHNVVKHSGTNAATVSLKAVTGGVVLRIADRGVGFDRGARQSRNALGLISMRERAALLRAHFVVSSKPHQGTVIEVHVPVSGAGR